MSSWQLLHVICAGGLLKLLQRRITPDNVNAELGIGETPLMVAAKYGQTQAVAMLLQLGADVRTQKYYDWDGNGVQALHVARDSATVRLLVHGGAPVDAGVLTPLSYALRDNRVDAARTLIDYGARLDRVSCPIPRWMADYVSAREWCRHAARVVVGIRKFRHSTVLSTNGRDAIQLIARLVWQTRMDPAWEQCPEPPAKK